jgi:hypothetical protein
MQLPIPANMEGQGNRNPYSRLNTAFNPRLAVSDFLMGMLPGPTGLVDRLTGNRIRSQVDRAVGGEEARLQREYDSYMREMRRNDDPSRGRGRTTATEESGESTSGGFLSRFFNRTQRGSDTPAPAAPTGPSGLSFQEYMRGQMRDRQGGIHDSVARYAPTLGGGVGSGGGSRTSSVGGYISGPAAQEMFAGMREGSMDQQSRGLARQAMDRNFVQ